MSQTALKYYTEQEYLDFERNEQQKHEYYKGEIFAMSGTSYKHNVIQVNLLVKLGIHLDGKGCRPFGNDLRVHIPKNSLYTYPDLLVVCDEPKFANNEFDTLLNPSVIIEILSPGTANYDRGTKFDLYRDIESLKEYVLVDSTTVHCVRYAKNTDNTWTLFEAKSLEDEFILSSIAFKTTLAAVYKDAI